MTAQEYMQAQEAISTEAMTLVKRAFLSSDPFERFALMQDYRAKRAESTELARQWVKGELDNGRRQVDSDVAITPEIVC